MGFDKNEHVLKTEMLKHEIKKENILKTIKQFKKHNSHIQTHVEHKFVKQFECEHITQLTRQDTKS